MRYTVGLLLGDGIGPEIVPAARLAVDAGLAAVGADPLTWKELPFGHTAIADYGSHTPQVTLDELAGLEAWLCGPHDSASYPEPFRSMPTPSAVLRKHFDLYANLRPARAFPGGTATVPGMDLLIVRENSEGFYADRNMYAGVGELMPTSDVALVIGVFTRSAIERITRYGFEEANRRAKHVTVVHKANVLGLSTGLFLEACRAAAADYPNVIVDDFHIDAMTAHLVKRGEQFDVVLTENMFGDILSDLAGALAGSLGIAPSINASDVQAMAQAAHGSAPDIAGRDMSNPVAMILSGAMLLTWLADRHDDIQLRTAAAKIRAAVESTIAAGTCTPDLGGSATTSSFTRSVIDATKPEHN